jgi:1A family penicillin-binding protein
MEGPPLDAAMPAKDPVVPPSRTRQRWLRRLLLAIAVLVVLPVVLLVILCLRFPLPSNLNAYLPAPSTRIYDRQGHLLYQMLGPGGDRVIVPLSQIPPALRQATIAIEDNSFYHNPGIDPGAILRSLLLDVQQGRPAYGGSTITQQLVRTILLSPREREQDTLARKLHEAALALQLTLRLSKDQILALYLNNVYYGNLSYGVQAAAENYFGRPVSGLDLAQCALLAGLPQAPSRYDPVIAPQAALARRHAVLAVLRRDGYITEGQAQLANAEPLDLASPATGMLAPHFVFYVISQLEQRYGRTMLEEGGLQVTTSLDLSLQQQAEEEVRLHVARLRADHNVHDGALVAMDPQTGQVLAMVGSADFNDPAIDGEVNVALAPRQPGSAIKPFTYAAAFARGYTPATVVDDAPAAFPTKDGQPFIPQNYDLQFHGLVTLRTALANSYNIPAVKVLQYVGIPAMLQVAHAAGITTMNQVDRYGLALTLGGGEVRLLDLTDAYGTLADAGVHHDPVSILKVTNAQGKVLQQWRPSAGRQAITPQIAYLLTSILSDNTARLPAFGVDSPLQLDRPAAVKTGTTTDFRDNWTVGYTPNLVTGVWVGNANNDAMRDVTGVSGAAPIWHDFMEDALSQSPAQNFVRPPGIVTETICPGTGFPPDAACPQHFSEVFIAGTQPHAPRQSLHPVSMVALGAPATGSHLQITPSIPRDYQATAVDVQAAGITPGSLTILVDGHVAHRFAGMGGEWFWPLQEGTHRFQAVARGPMGTRIVSTISTITVSGPASSIW